MEVSFIFVEAEMEKSMAGVLLKMLNLVIQDKILISQGWSLMLIKLLK